MGPKKKRRIVKQQRHYYKRILIPIMVREMERAIVPMDIILIMDTMQILPQYHQ
jgi:hypothetical protein